MVGPWVPAKVLDEIRAKVHGYGMTPQGLAAGAVATTPVNGRVPVAAHPELIRSSRDNLFTSGTLGRYCKILNSVIEKEQIRS